MAFTYNFGANPQIDYIRLLISDTVDLNHVFEDSELLAALPDSAIDLANFNVVFGIGWGLSSVHASFLPESGGTRT